MREAFTSMMPRPSYSVTKRSKSSWLWPARSAMACASAKATAGMGGVWGREGGVCVRVHKLTTRLCVCVCVCLWRARDGHVPKCGLCASFSLNISHMREMGSAARVRPVSDSMTDALRRE